MNPLILFLTFSLFSAQQKVFVTKVLDGDTFQSFGTRYRLADIDAPENDQTHGVRSKKMLAKTILYDVVSVKVLKTDKYGRKIVKVSHDNRDVSEAMVVTGNAWWYARYSNSNKLRQLQNQARQHRRGLWKYKAINPEKFRNKN